jgi:non-canonical poly(A) RNA polymerase PAPD5/7
MARRVLCAVRTAVQAAELVKELRGKWPMLRPLILTLKLFLQQRELNEVRSGTLLDHLMD